MFLTIIKKVQVLFCSFLVKPDKLGIKRCSMHNSFLRTDTETNALGMTVYYILVLSII